jgi:kynurenine formamidase
LRESPAQTAMRQRLIDAARNDPRIVGLLCDGSHSSGRGDEWSDVDVSVFLRDADFDAFAANWEVWAATFGDLLLGYTSWVGHPWAVYDAKPVPLRVDFDLHRESTIEKVRHWPVSLTLVEDAVWYDATGGRLSAAVEPLIGKSLAPHDPHLAFEQLCGDLWYELLYAYSRLQRGEMWVARQAFHYRALEPLLRLLRFEAGAFERWQASPAAADIERVLSPERLKQLDSCIPGPGSDGILTALCCAARLGQEVCSAIARRHGWEWPERLAERAVELLDRTENSALERVSAMRLVDLSRVISHREPGNAGAVPPQVWPWRTHEETKPLYQTEYSYANRLLSFMDHTSTHVDAPLHFDNRPGALDIAGVPLERFFGPAICVDVRETSRQGWIDVVDIEAGLRKHGLSINPDDIVLFFADHYRKTYPRPEYFTDYPGLTPAAAMWLNEQGVRNFGVEGPNAGHPSDRVFEVHLICRNTGMIHMEGLANLDQVVGRRFTFSGFPLKIRNGTGSPIRAVAIFDE